MNTIPRHEYPRPDFRRSEWLNLNGKWDFEFDDAAVGENEKWYNGHQYSKEITVPYCYQCRLSGINDTTTHDVVWYSKDFNLPQEFKNKKVLLNFGAVDYFAKVWVNGELVCTHKGGNTPFKCEINRYLKDGGNNIILRAEDSYELSQPRGKQHWQEEPEGIRYTNTTGIWQSVWLESVGKVYIDRIRFTPNIEDKTVLTEIYLDKYIDNIDVNINVTFNDNIIKTYNTKLNSKISKITLNLNNEHPVRDNMQCWTPETPYLYYVEVVISRNNNMLDKVNSYFGLRKISIKNNQIFLNNKPFYQRLVLDQGYWKESLMTPPSEEAIIKDIELTKQLGFNGVRKHQKMEDPRYLYWADKLGLVVWGEMPSAYAYNTQSIANITSEWTDFINRDYNHPCIIAWVPLNESWGVRNVYSNKEQQNFARSLYYLTKGIDSTRFVSTNDGWEQVKADICGIHDYAAMGDEIDKKYSNIDTIMESASISKMIYCDSENYEGQPILITEYGGIAFDNNNSNEWGYNDKVKSEEEFLLRYESITSAIMRISYVCGFCYTQLTDTFQEANGLLTMDRKPKADIKSINRINLSKE